MELFKANGDREAELSNLESFGDPPVDALALKFADDIEDGYWVTDEDDLRRLRKADAPLSFTQAGLRAISF